MREFLAQVDVRIQTEDDARKRRLGPDEVRDLLQDVSQVWVARGKSFERLELKGGAVDVDEILKKVIGPSGNLRAPTLRLGRKLIVGFYPEMYATLFQ